MFLIKVLNIVLCLLICISLSQNASLSLHEQKKYANLIEGQGLYAADDDVDILTSGNFKNRVYGQKNVWLIEFYNSWCGFCQRFAPSWKALATDTKSWKEAVNIGALDCADDENSALCRDFEIMSYPTLRYFHENYTADPTQLGVEITKGSDMDEHKYNLVRYMITEQENGRGVSMPNLLPYTKFNLLHLFQGINVNSKYVFLIIDTPESIIGPEITLDFHKFPEIGVRYATSENTELAKYVSSKKTPFMMVLSDQNISHHFPVGLNTRDALRAAIIEYVKPEIMISDLKKNDNIFTGKWLEAEVPDLSTLIELKSRKMLRDKIKLMGDVLFQADLEYALRQSLKHEIGNMKNIKGDKMKALRDYVSVLVKYFPLGTNGKIFLMEISDKIKDDNGIKGAEISDIVSKYEPEDKQVFSSKKQWIACDGSTPTHRGYPCGLWKLFHYLTVAAADLNGEPKEVLHAMYGYVKYFFGCADCSKHFQEMAVKKELESVASANSAVLWLWMAHNDVNKRLAGDATEDPEFPKIQFPTKDKCAKCRKDDGTWEYNEVLKYLSDLYKNVNIRYIGSDTSVLHPGLESSTGGSTSFFKQIDAKGL